MLRHKDVISVLLGPVVVAGVGSKPTFAKLVHLYFSTIYKMKSDKCLFMTYIPRRRGRIIANKLSRLSKLRNAKLQNCRLSYAANKIRDVHSIIGSSNDFLITSVFSLASVF